MDRERFTMGAPREPNVYRPYYVPASTGTSQGASPSQTPYASSTNPPRPQHSVSSAARDLLPDIDIDLKSSTSEAWQNSRGLIDTLVWRYTSVLLAQPFDVAKTILQVSKPPSASSASTPSRPRSSRQPSGQHNSNKNRREQPTPSHSSDSSDSDSDIPAYFTSTSPQRSHHRRRSNNHHQHHHYNSIRDPNHRPRQSSSSPTPAPRRTRRASSRSPTPLSSSQQLSPKTPSSILSTLSTLHQTSGAVGLWRATNTTFLYTILLRTTDAFLRSLLLTLLGLPEIPGPDQGGLGPGLLTSSAVPAGNLSGLDVSDSPSPLTSLFVVGAASALAGILLAPVELVRTKLVVTPLGRGPRGLVQNLRKGGRRGLVAPVGLWVPTALFHSAGNVFGAGAAFVMRRYLGVVPEANPALWSCAGFGVAMAELFVRLPFETVLRRAQVGEISRAEREKGRVMEMIVEPAGYDGVWATFYAVVFTEGETVVEGKDGRVVKRSRGQGFAGLVKGWRIGFWGLVGVWGAGALGPADGRAGGQF